MLPGQQLTPADILHILARRKWLIVVPFVLVTLAGFAAVSTLEDQYRSETVILVVPQRVPEEYVRSTVTARIEERLSSIQQQILSRSRLEKIILDFDLYKRERNSQVMEDVVARMRDSDIRVRIERGDAFRVQYVNRDPRLAQRVTERLATMFIDENLRDRENLAEGTSLFLDGQLEDARRRLIEQEKRLEQYRRQFSGQLPSQVQPNLQAMQNTQQGLQTLSASLDNDRQRHLLLQQERARLEAPDATEAAIAAALPDAASTVLTPAQRLQEMQTRLRALEQKYTAEHPDIDAAKRVIRTLEDEVKAAASGAAPPTRLSGTASLAAAARLNRLNQVRDEMTTIELQIQRREQQVKEMRASIDSYQAKVDAAPTRESELAELTRDYAVMQQAYENLVKRREESRIAANLERRQIGEQFKVLDQARVPEKPFKPNRLMLNAGAAGVGLSIGLAIAVLLELRDTTLRTAAQVESVLTLPVLALVPMLQAEQLRIRRSRRRWAAATVMVLLVAGAAAGYLVLRQLRGA